MAATAPQPLTSLPLGASGTVAEIKLPPANRPRLMEMGLLVGTQVELVRFAPMGDPALRHCAVLAGDIRKLDVSVEVGTDRKLKRMLEIANKLAARYTLMVGDNEIVTQTYSLKNMTSGEQETLTRQQLLGRLAGRDTNGHG